MNQVYRKAVFLLVVILAIAYVSNIRNRVTVDPLERGGDTETYYFLANQLVNEKIYAERQWGQFERFRAWRPPLYPIFLASALLVSNNNLSFVITLQYALLLISGLLIYLYNDDSFFGGIFSLVLYYSYSAFYFFASFFYSESLFVFILVSFLWIFSKGIESKNRYLIGLSGLLFGISMLLRTVFLPIFIGVTILVALSSGAKYLRKKIWNDLLNTIVFGKLIEDEELSKSLIIFISASWLVITPVIARNFFVLSDLVLINSANGLNLYLGTRKDIYRENDNWWGENWRVSGGMWNQAHEEIINPIRERFGEVGSQRQLLKISLQEFLKDPWVSTSHRLHIIYRYLVPNLNSHQFSKVGSLALYTYSDYLEASIRVLFLVCVVLVLLSQDQRGLILLLFFILLVTSSSMAFFSERFVVVTTTLYFGILGRGFVNLEKLIKKSGNLTNSVLILSK